MWYGNSLRSVSTSPQTNHRLAARTSRPTYPQILDATEAAVRVFEARDMPICAVGGLACKLLGNPRTPNDTDLLVLNTSFTQEQIKAILVNGNSKFYLVPARDPRATFKVLWYRTDSDTRIKVDLLQPGIMSIPNISPSEIEYKETQGSILSATRTRIPNAPFGLVLLLKLQAWEQHRESLESRFREKQYTDSRDINFMLPIAVADTVKFDSLPEEFLGEARRRVILYTQTYPESDEQWRRLGFKTFKSQTASRRPTQRTSTSLYTSQRYTRTATSATEGDELADLLGRMRVASRTGRAATSYSSRLTGFD